MFVRHLMTRDVFTLSRQMTCRQVFESFRARHIRRAPVIDREQLAGIVTLHDLLRVLPGTVGQNETDAGHSAFDLPVDTIMTHPVRTVEPHDHLETAALIMLEHKVGALPVCRDGKLVGILTESDIFRALWSVLSSGSGWRAIVEEHASAPEVDYAALLAAQGGRLQSLLRFPVPTGGAVVFLRATGAASEAAVQSLWAAGLTVQQVDRK